MNHQKSDLWETPTLWTRRWRRDFDDSARSPRWTSATNGRRSPRRAGSPQLMDPQNWRKKVKGEDDNDDDERGERMCKRSKMFKGVKGSKVTLCPAYCLLHFYLPAFFHFSPWVRLSLASAVCTVRWSYSGEMGLPWPSRLASCCCWSCHVW